MADYTVPSGVFRNVTGATGEVGQGNYEKPGRYIERIDAVKFKATRTGKNGFIIEKTVIVVVQAPKDWHDGKPGQIVPMIMPRPGEKVTDFIDIDKDYGPNAIKQFLMAVFGVPRELHATVTDQHATLACGPGQPCAGLLVEVNNVEQDNKPKTVTYTRISYLRRVRVAELANMALTDEALAVLGGPDGMAAALEKEVAADAAAAAPK